MWDIFDVYNFFDIFDVFENITIFSNVADSGCSVFSCLSCYQASKCCPVVRQSFNVFVRYCYMLQEFLFFLLPLINFRRVKNVLVRNLLRKTTAETGASHQRSDDAYKECVVCAEWPTHPHSIVNCPHVFCYFCLQVVYTMFRVLLHQLPGPLANCHVGYTAHSAEGTPITTVGGQVIQLIAVACHLQSQDCISYAIVVSNLVKTYTVLLLMN